jgi:hypothetical protein
VGLLRISTRRGTCSGKVVKEKEVMPLEPPRNSNSSAEPPLPA